MSREKLVGMIRLLYAEVRAHAEDYHHVTPPARLERVIRSMVAEDGRLPESALLPDPD